MKSLEKIDKGTYIVAVSGGVDSVVLLDLLSKQKNLNLIVAHFDHGIRESSQKDAEFVQNLASGYGLKFEIGEGKLGKTASEETARDARYKFLHETKKKHQAEKIVVAHHSDDIIETIIINMLRGTGWKGLSSLRSSEEILRPLLNISKKEVFSYAKKHNLKWVEDETNRDEKYLRNRVRHNILSHMSEAKKSQFLDLYNNQLKLHKQIVSQAADLHTNYRHNYIMWPRSVALEVLRSRYEITRPQAERLLHAIKTAKTGTEYEITGKKSVLFTDKTIKTVLK